MFSMRCYCQSGDWFSIRPSPCGTRTQSVLVCIPTRSVGTRWFANDRDVYLGPGWKHSLSNGIGVLIAIRAISDSVSFFATNKKGREGAAFFRVRGPSRPFYCYMASCFFPQTLRCVRGLGFNFGRFSSNSYDHRMDSGSPQAPPGMTVLVCRR